MRIGGVVFVLRSGSDFVVGLREDAVERNTLRVVAKRLERMNLSHLVSVSGSVLCRAKSLLVYAKYGRFWEGIEGFRDPSCRIHNGLKIAGSAETDGKHIKIKDSWVSLT